MPLGYLDAEVAQSGKYAIMYCTLEISSAKWAFLSSDL